MGHDILVHNSNGGFKGLWECSSINDGVDAVTVHQLSLAADYKKKLHHLYDVLRMHKLCVSTIVSRMRSEDQL